MDPTKPPRYEFVRDNDEPTDGALPFGVYLRHRSGGRDILWIRTKAATKKSFYCVLGWHKVPGGQARCYKPPLGIPSTSRDRACATCVGELREKLRY